MISNVVTATLHTYTASVPENDKAVLSCVVLSTGDTGRDMDCDTPVSCLLVCIWNAYPFVTARLKLFFA